MDKSPLRKLAEAYAQEKISLEHYREQRRRLLDAIEDGDIKLRNPSPEVPPGAPQAETSQIAHRGLSAIAIAATLVLVLLIWKLLPETIPERAPSASGTPTGSAYVSPAQQLLEQFLSTNRWDSPTLDDFETRWQRLPEASHLTARTKPWFQGLKNALSLELNTRKALAALSTSMETQAAINRLIAFGMELGIGDLEPTFSTPKALPIEATATTTPSAPELSSPHEGDDLNGARWLKSQTDGHFSLQLFAVNRLHKVESLIAHFPELQLKLVPFEQANPRFRLLYGVFPSRKAAQTAYNNLPEALRLQQPNPIIKTVQELKAGLEKTKESLIYSGRSRL